MKLTLRLWRMFAGIITMRTFSLQLAMIADFCFGT
jgi:hypothetical protein